MGTISSGVGLVSGLDIQSLVTQLMAIEARTYDQIQTRIETNTVRQTALMTIQARVMALQVNAAGFNDNSVFNQKAVTSTDEDVLSADASEFAAQGTYRFTTKRLASNHLFVSRGYTSTDTGIGSGTVSFEIGNGQLARTTELSFINGQQGFDRGELIINDRAGNSEQIDLASALTVDDVLKQINENLTIKVNASVSGDSLVITDISGGTGTMSISGSAADSLGITGVADAQQPNQIIGRDIIYLTNQTAIAQLNDGNGLRGLGFGDDLIFTQSGQSDPLLSLDLKDTLSETIGDPASSNTLQSLNGGNGIRIGAFRITDQNGRSIDIDLNELVAEHGPRVTIGHVKEFIQQKVDEKNQQLNSQNNPNFVGMAITVSFSGADNLTISDTSQPLIPDDTERLSNFIIEDLDEGLAAADLGIVDDVAGNYIHGETVWRMDSLGDVANAINNHWSNWNPMTPGDNKQFVMVDIDSVGNGLTITNQTSDTLTIADTAAAADLGLVHDTGFTGNYTGHRLIAGLNTVLLRSLNGGSAGPDQISTESTINLTDRAGTTANLDLTDAQTVQDVVDAINQADTNITANINQAGNGIILTDDSSTVGGAIAVSGDLAEKLNLLVDAADGLTSTNSGNLQLQYISEATNLSDLRGGQGIRLGKITVSDGDGNRINVTNDDGTTDIQVFNRTIDLARDDIKTVQDVIDAFASSRTNLRARINDTGDGLLIYDDISTGGVSIEIDDDGGSTAADLGILGKSGQGENFIDGSYEYKIEMGGGDTIQDLVDRLSQADIGVNASIINDGSQNNPYRISFSSQISGRAGRIYLDAGATNLTTQNLTDGDDALILFGDNDGPGNILISSSSNTISGTVKGVTLELKSVSDTPVEITVSQDLDSISTQIKAFVDAYNGIMAEIEAKDSFNPDTLERGVLFGEHTVDTVRSVLESMINRIVPGMPSDYNRLADIGIKIAPFGSETITDPQGKETQVAVATTLKLEFDEEKFRAAFAE
ncbi:MAG: flagellar filament capping protein FliD, partial [Planctomycetes bacterium]|nr:flagellar filament capping protein FliD [Planctomycetota bacterium]